MDPYLLPDSHAAAISRLTCKAAVDFIAKDSVSLVRQGRNLGMVWRDGLLRRTYCQI